MLVHVHVTVHVHVNIIYPCFNSEQSQVEDDGSASATTCIKRWLPNPFVKLLQDLWPFGQDFKDLGIGGKIYEIVKVQASYMYMYMCMYVYIYRTLVTCTLYMYSSSQ